MCIWHQLAGILGILTSLELFCCFYCINAGSITIALDSYSALAQSCDSAYLSVEAKSFDYLQDIQRHLSSLPVSVCWRWVKAH